MFGPTEKLRLFHPPREVSQQILQVPNFLEVGVRRCRVDYIKVLLPPTQNTWFSYRSVPSPVAIITYTQHHDLRKLSPSQRICVRGISRNTESYAVVPKSLPTVDDLDDWSRCALANRFLPLPDDLESAFLQEYCDAYPALALVSRHQFWLSLC